MGGTQSRPFILCPSEWVPPSQQLVGAENVHLQFVRWLADLGHTAYTDLPDVPHRLVRTPGAEANARVAGASGVHSPAGEWRGPPIESTK